MLACECVAAREPQGVLSPEHPFIQSVVREIHLVCGDRLVSIAIFGSVARRTARPDSDLDLFLVVDGLPDGRRARLASFDPVERGLAGDIVALAQRGIAVELSPVLRTPADLTIASPLLLDLTEDAVVLEDRDGSARARSRIYGNGCAGSGPGASGPERRGTGTSSPITAAARSSAYDECHPRAQLLREGSQATARSRDSVRGRGLFGRRSRSARAGRAFPEGGLRFVGIEPPKQHDVAPLLLQHRDRLPAEDGRGHGQNPVTGASYPPQLVKRGDFGRVIAEYWADGPDSDPTPATGTRSPTTLPTVRASSGA